MTPATGGRAEFGEIGCRRTGRTRRNGEPTLDLPGLAGRALHDGSAPDQQFEIGAAAGAVVFVDGHVVRSLKIEDFRLKIG